MFAIYIKFASNLIILLKAVVTIIFFNKFLSSWGCGLIIYNLNSYFGKFKLSDILFDSLNNYSVLIFTQTLIFL